MRGKVISENAYALILCITKLMDRETALVKCGVEIPNANKGKLTKPPKIKNDEVDIVYGYYYNDNMSLDEIGAIYKVSPVTVKNFLHRNGIPVKGKGRYTK